MDFPEKEAQALLDWMREQMYGDTVTEWTYGNEHDRMSEAADFLSGLLSREGRRYGDLRIRQFHNRHTRRNGNCRSFLFRPFYIPGKGA